MLSLQSLTRKVSAIVSPTARTCYKEAVLAFLHPFLSPGMTQYPQDLLGDEEMNLHRLREGKILAYLPVGRGRRVNFLTLSQQSSLAVNESLWDRQATREY